MWLALGSTKIEIDFFLLFISLLHSGLLFVVVVVAFLSIFCSIRNLLSFFSSIQFSFHRLIFHRERIVRPNMGFTNLGIEMYYAWLRFSVVEHSVSSTKYFSDMVKYVCVCGAYTFPCRSYRSQFISIYNFAHVGYAKRFFFSFLFALFLQGNLNVMLFYSWFV